MAGLGAMTIGLIGGGIAWFCFIVFRCLIALVISIDSYIHKMRVGIWCVMAIIFGSYALIVYIYARVKMETFKCESCGEKVGQKKNFCPVCGTEVAKFDDGAFAKKSIKWIIIGHILLIIFSGIYMMLTEMINIL